MGAAFEELVGQHLNDLYGTALCCAGGAERAEELLYGALRRAFHEFPSPRDVPDFRLWVLAIIARACLEGGRRRGVDPWVVAPGAALGIEAEEIPVPLPLPGTPAYAAAGDALKSALWSLEVGTRMSVWLVNVLGLRYREAAQCLGVPVEQVMTALVRGRRRLHAELARSVRKAAGAP